MPASSLEDFVILVGQGMCVAGAQLPLGFNIKSKMAKVSLSMHSRLRWIFITVLMEDILMLADLG